MHDHPTDLADYDWPTCVTPGCGRQLWVNETGRWACRPCEDATGRRLTELPGLFRQLDTTAALMRGASKQAGGASGTKTPPIPPRLEVLALVGPGGVAARLAAVEDAWRQTLGWTIAPWRGNPRQAVPKHVEFLINNLPWACDRYEPIGQDIAELRRLHGEIKAAVERKPKFGNVKIGLCPTPVEGEWCGEQLFASARSFKTRCQTCGTSWEGEDEWRALRAAQNAVEDERQQRTAEALGVAA